MHACLSFNSEHEKSTNFLEPVTVCMPYPVSTQISDDSEEMELSLMYHKGDEWIDVSQESKLFVDMESNTIKFELEHFSAYKIFRISF